MRTRLIYVENGKIIFTKAELEALLDQVYNDGYNDGMIKHGGIYEKVTTPTIVIKDGNREIKEPESPWQSPFIYCNTTADATISMKDTQFPDTVCVNGPLIGSIGDNIATFKGRTEVGGDTVSATTIVN